MTTRKQTTSAGSAPNGKNAGRHWLLPAIALVIVTTAVYWQVTQHDFVHWDDNLHTYENPYLKQLTPDNVAYFWRHSYFGLYVPITYTTYALLAQLGRMSHPDRSITVMDTQLNPHVFHAASLAAHLVNVLLVFAILLRLTSFSRTKALQDSEPHPNPLLGKEREPTPLPQPLSPPGKGEQEKSRTSQVWPAFAGALLFALHPLQVESVAWISEWRGVLSGAFSLCAVYAYLRAVGNRDAGYAEGVPIGRPAYWLALALSVAAQLSKPTAVALPFVLFVIDRWMIGRPLRSCALSVLTWVVIALPFIAATHNAQPLPARDITALWQRPFIAGDALAFYLAKFIAPWHLTIDYGRKPAMVLGQTWGYLTWLAPAAVAVVVFLLRRTRPWLVAGALLSLSMLLPVIGLVPFGYQEYSTTADRYVYLAMLGPAIILAGWLAELGRYSNSDSPFPGGERGWGRRLAFVVSGVALATLTGLTALQLGYWANSSTLYEHALNIYPRLYELRENYGVSLDDEGRFADAITQYEAAIRVHPHLSVAYNDLGTALEQEGRPEDAVTAFETAIAQDPGSALAYRNLGLALLDKREPALAAIELGRSVNLDPLDARAHAIYGQALMELGRPGDALGELQKAVSLDPSPINHDQLGVTYAMTGNMSAARSEFQTELALDPSSAMGQRHLQMTMGR